MNQKPRNYGSTGQCVLPGRHTQGEPAVKYRGVFINDEAAALGQWHRPYFGGREFKSAFYEKVFEVLLRLKANYLWPAVWDHAFAEDDPKNHARSLGGRAEDRGRHRGVA